MNVALWVSLFLGAILVSLSGLHFYWAFGGSWGKKGTIPDHRGKPLFHPSITSTLVVAFGLLVAAAVALSLGGAVTGNRSLPGLRAASGFWGVVFVARSIGDRKYVGFFKRVRRTGFAYWDTRLFSPVALAMGLGFLFLWLWTG